MSELNVSILVSILGLVIGLLLGINQILGITVGVYLMYFFATSGLRLNTARYR